MVWNYQNADCSLRKNFIASFITIFGTLSFLMASLCPSVCVWKNTTDFMHNKMLFINKSMFSLLHTAAVTDTARICCCPSCCMLRRRCCRARMRQARRAAIDWHRLPAGRPAANPPQQLAAGEWWDRRTDGRTPDRYVDRAASYSNNVCSALIQS